MIGFIKIHYSGPVPQIAKRELGRIKKEAFRIAGELWHKEIRPKHFTNRGATEYGYTPRSGERGNPAKVYFPGTYTGRKLKKFGHTRPLEWSGESRDASERRDVRATSKGVRVVMRVPRLNFRNKNSKIRMRDELTTVSPGDAIKMVKIFEVILNRRYRTINKKITKRVF